MKKNKFELNQENLIKKWIEDENSFIYGYLQAIIDYYEDRIKTLKNDINNITGETKESITRIRDYHLWLFRKEMLKKFEHYFKLGKS